MPIELKICGINSQNIIEEIVKNGGCKYLGFVFYPSSPRNVSIEQSKKLTSIVPDHIKKVAVLVKPENSFVERIKDQFDYLQVYDTSPSKVKELKLISNKNSSATPIYCLYKFISSLFFTFIAWIIFLLDINFNSLTFDGEVS